MTSLVAAFLGALVVGSAAADAPTLAGWTGTLETTATNQYTGQQGADVNYTNKTTLQFDGKLTRPVWKDDENFWHWDETATYQVTVSGYIADESCRRVITSAAASGTVAVSIIIFDGPNPGYSVGPNWTTAKNPTAVITASTTCGSQWPLLSGYACSRVPGEGFTPHLTSPSATELSGDKTVDDGTDVGCSSEYQSDVRSTWRLTRPATACSDAVDNDRNGQVDFNPDSPSGDSGCDSPVDDSETGASNKPPTGSKTTGNSTPSTPAQGGSGNPGLVRRVCGNKITGIVSTAGSTGLGIGAAGSEGGAGMAVGGIALGTVGLGCSVLAPTPGSGRAAEGACVGLSTVGIGLGVGALALAPALGPFALPVLALSLGSMMSGISGYIACEGDPPIGSYRTVARPRVGPVHLRFGKGITAPQKSVMAAITMNAAETKAYGLAMMLCIDRASGATQAQAAAWVQKQRACASTYAHRLSSLTRAQLGLRKALVGLLKQAQVRDTKLARRTLVTAVTSLSAAAKRQLKEAGASDDQITFVEQAISQLKLPGTTQGFLESIDGATVVAAVRKAAHSFDVISLEYR